MIKFKVIKSKKLPVENLSQIVDRLIGEYFEAHGKYLPPAGLYSRVIKAIEKPLIERTLLATKGNQIKAAEVLDINRNTLRKKMRDLGIEVVK